MNFSTLLLQGQAQQQWVFQVMDFIQKTSSDRRLIHKSIRTCIELIQNMALYAMPDHPCFFKITPHLSGFAIVAGNSTTQEHSQNLKIIFDGLGNPKSQKEIIGDDLRRPPLSTTSLHWGLYLIIRYTSVFHIIPISMCRRDVYIWQNALIQSQ